MGLFTTRCPVDYREQTWIEESMSWFRTTFGAGTLSRAVVVPTPEFFPGPYSGTAADIPEMVTRVCRYWAEHLDTNPRSYLKGGLRYLGDHEHLDRISGSALECRSPRRG